MTEVPGYQLDRLIGRGATGEVWLARQRSAGGRVVALKCLAAPDAQHARDQLRVEGRVLAALDHPHIVTLYDVVERPGGIALVMQYAAGGSLASLLGQRRLTPGQVVSLAAPLADALAYAHAQGTIHGDVTPANVLFTEDGRPLLADFGVARVAARLSTRSGLVGTPHYLDPQVALGAAPDAASDLYALGAICYEALTGRPPYTGATPFELLQHARDGDRPDLHELAPDAPAALVVAIDAALAVDPAQRPLDAAAFASSLRAAVEPEPLLMLPRDVPVAVETPSRPTREFGPRPPRRGADEDQPTGTWDKLGSLAADSRLRLSAIGVLVAAALGSVALLVAGVGDTDAEATSAAAPGAPRPSASANASQPTSRPAAQSSTASAAASSASPAPQLASPSSAADWRSVLGGLDERRSRAYATADVALIDTVYAPGPELDKDRASIAGLVTNKQRVEGLRLNYRDVRVLTATPTTATLDVTDELPAYRLLDSRGALVQAQPGRGPKRWVIRLTRAAGEWRIAGISTAT